MKGIAFIDLARAMLGRDRTEAQARSTVSRAYYGVFHRCLELIPQEFAPTAADRKGASSHMALIDAFHRWGASNSPARAAAQRTADELRELKRSRVQADYKIAEPFRVNADRCVSRAEELVRLVAQARQAHDS